MTHSNHDTAGGDRFGEAILVGDEEKILRCPRRGGDHEEEHAAHEVVTRAFRCGRDPMDELMDAIPSQRTNRAPRAPTQG